MGGNYGVEKVGFFLLIRRSIHTDVVCTLGLAVHTPGFLSTEN